MKTISPFFLSYSLKYVTLYIIFPGIGNVFGVIAGFINCLSGGCVRIKGLKTMFLIFMGGL